MRDLAVLRGVGGPLFWTGGDIELRGNTLRNVWADNRTFDSVVANFSVPVTEA